MMSWTQSSTEVIQSSGASGSGRRTLYLGVSAQPPTLFDRPNTISRTPTSDGDSRGPRHLPLQERNSGSGERDTEVSLKDRRGSSGQDTGSDKGSSASPRDLSPSSTPSAGPQRRPSPKSTGKHAPAPGSFPSGARLLQGSTTADSTTQAGATTSVHSGRQQNVSNLAAVPNVTSSAARISAASTAAATTAAAAAARSASAITRKGSNSDFKQQLHAQRQTRDRIPSGGITAGDGGGSGAGVGVPSGTFFMKVKDRIVEKIFQTSTEGPQLAAVVQERRQRAAGMYEAKLLAECVDRWKERAGGTQGGGQEGAFPPGTHPQGGVMVTVPPSAKQTKLVPQQQLLRQASGKQQTLQKAAAGPSDVTPECLISAAVGSLSGGRGAWARAIVKLSQQQEEQARLAAGLQGNGPGGSGVVIDAVRETGETSLAKGEIADEEGWGRGGIGGGGEGGRASRKGKWGVVVSKLGSIAKRELGDTGGPAVEGRDDGIMMTSLPSDAENRTSSTDSTSMRNNVKAVTIVEPPSQGGGGGGGCDGERGRGSRKESIEASRLAFRRRRSISEDNCSPLLPPFSSTGPSTLTSSSTSFSMSGRRGGGGGGAPADLKANSLTTVRGGHSSEQLSSSGGGGIVCSSDDFRVTFTTQVIEAMEASPQLAEKLLTQEIIERSKQMSFGKKRLSKRTVSFDGQGGSTRVQEPPGGSTRVRFASFGLSIDPTSSSSSGATQPPLAGAITNPLNPVRTPSNPLVPKPILVSPNLKSERRAKRASQSSVTSSSPETSNGVSRLDVIDDDDDDIDATAAVISDVSSQASPRANISPSLLSSSANEIKLRAMSCLSGSLGGAMTTRTIAVGKRDTVVTTSVGGNRGTALGGRPAMVLTKLSASPAKPSSMVGEDVTLASDITLWASQDCVVGLSEGALSSPGVLDAPGAVFRSVLALCDGDVESTGEHALSNTSRYVMSCHDDASELSQEEILQKDDQYVDSLMEPEVSTITRSVGQMQTSTKYGIPENPWAVQGTHNIDPIPVPGTTESAYPVGTGSPVPADVVFDEHGQTWDVYGAEFDPEILGDAIQIHLETIMMTKKSSSSSSIRKTSGIRSRASSSTSSSSRSAGVDRATATEYELEPLRGRGEEEREEGEEEDVEEDAAEDEEDDVDASPPSRRKNLRFSLSTSKEAGGGGEGRKKRMGLDEDESVESHSDGFLVRFLCAAFSKRRNS